MKIYELRNDLFIVWAIDNHIYNDKYLYLMKDYT